MIAQADFFFHPKHFPRRNYKIIIIKSKIVGQISSQSEPVLFF